MNNLFASNIAEISISYSTHVKAADRVKITRSQDAYKIFIDHWPSIEHREYFYAMFLNRANAVLGIYQVSIGGLSGTVVDPKIVFQAALKANASSVIVAHNHPSGSIIPSDADKTLTKRMKNGGEFLEIPILDHLIITEEKYLSFADEGML